MPTPSRPLVISPVRSPAPALLLVLLAGGAGCASKAPYAWVNELPLSPAAGERLLEPRDVLLVDVRNQKELSGEVTVRDDGHFLQPSAGTIKAAGLSPSQVASSIASRLQGVIVDPQVTVAVKSSAPIKVNVVGQVRTPGSYELVRDRSVTAALAAAGWLNEFAGEDDVFVVRPAEQQARIRFRVKDLTAAAPHSARFQLRDGDVVVVE